MNIPTTASPKTLSKIPQHVDVAIIGGGLVGLATALRFLERYPASSLVLLEKDAQVGCQQSTHNSGVLHSGLYYKPGSEKARLCVEGLDQMTEFCKANNVAHEICGKVVIATQPDQLPRLETLFERGTQNGVRNLQKLTPEQIREIEPNTAGIAGIRVPTEGIVDYRGVADAMQRQIEAHHGVVCVSAKVTKITSQPNGLRIITSRGDLSARFAINCAGLHSDKVVQAAGQNRPARIVPFRGEYYTLRPERQNLVKHLIYPVPDPKFPFLGVHFTRMIFGGVECGPNAVLAFAREGYRKTDFNAGELADALTYSGLWRFLARYPAMTLAELYRSFSRSAFCASLQELVPAIQLSDLGEGGSGVRAQAVYPDGKFVEDFLFVRLDKLLHVVNAPSPGATASLAIGRRIVDECNYSASKF